MSRGLSAPNEAETNAQYLQPVVLVSLAFSTPVYVHSGIGTITYNGNDYLGVGDFGGVGEIRESENLGPNPIRLELSGVNANYVAEALTAGNYGDVVSIFMGYRADDGTLVDDPWPIARGKYEFANTSQDETAVVSITAQHDLAILVEIEGSKYTDEDQRQRYSADVGFQFVSDAATVQLLWGGSNRNPGATNTTGTQPRPVK